MSQGDQNNTETGSRWALKEPLVSVIIPAYNAERYICEAIDSALSQDYKNKEVIVVNDGSVDDTARILDSYGQQIRRIDQCNAGVAEARNSGLKASNGEYVAFLDADDIWLPGKLTVQAAYMERYPHIDLVQGEWQPWLPDMHSGLFPSPASIESPAAGDPDKLPPLVPDRSGWVYHRLLTEFMICTDVVMARRRLIERVGWFDRRLVFGEDFDYWIRASRYTQVYTIDRLMALYRQHTDNTTRRCPERNYADEIIASAVRQWGLEDRDGSRASARCVRRHRARLWAGFGYKQLRAGWARNAMASLIRAIALHPLRPQHWMLLGYSVLASGGLGRVLQKRGKIRMKR